MNKYEVVFRGTSSVEATLIIAAESNEEAERLAEDTDPTTLDWEADPDSEVSGVYVSNSYLVS